MPNLYRKHLELFQKDLQLHSSMSYSMENKEKNQNVAGKSICLGYCQSKGGSKAFIRPALKGSLREEKTAKKKNPVK